jgi:hypothetical protein
MTGRLRLPHLRVALAAVVLFDLGSLCVFLGDLGQPIAGADTWSRTIASWLWRAGIATLGTVATVQFARRPGRLLAGVIALICLAILSTAHGRLFGSPWRHLFFSGLCLAGWLLGLAHARWQGRPHDEAMARMGGLALLSAAYLNGGISKLAFGGQEWLSGVTIQALVLGQDGLVAEGPLGLVRAWVVHTPAVAAMLAWATTAFELGAPLMLSRGPLRPIVALGLVAMHATIYATTGILYPESMALLVLFAVVSDPGVLPTEPRESRTFRWQVGVLAVLAALAIVHQARRFRESEVSTTQPRAVTLERLGPFSTGQTVARDWSIEALEVGERRFTLALTSHLGRVRFDFTCDPQAASPFDLGRGHLSYRTDPLLPFATVEPLGQVLRQVVRDAIAQDDVCSAWTHWIGTARGP